MATQKITNLPYVEDIIAMSKFVKTIVEIMKNTEINKSPVGAANKTFSLEECQEITNNCKTTYHIWSTRHLPHSQPEGMSHSGLYNQLDLKLRLRLTPS